MAWEREAVDVVMVLGSEDTASVTVEAGKKGDKS